MKRRFCELKLFVVLLPRFIDGFVFVHPFDSFKARRKCCRNDANLGPKYFRSPAILIVTSQQVTHPISSRFATTKSDDLGESQNRTISDKTSSLQEINKGSATGGTNSSNNKPMALSSDRNSSTNDKSKPVTNGINPKNEAYRGSGIGSYFPFLHQSQPTSRKVPRSTKVAENRDNENKSASTLLNKEANDTITVADIDVLLSKIPLPSNSETISTRRMQVSKESPAPGSLSTKASTRKASSSKGSLSTSASQVAFPQPSTVTQKEIQRGTGIASCLLGMLVGITILPNLWLVGMVLGVLYGYDITKDVADDEQVDKNIVARFLISCGTQLAKAYLKVLDGGKALWFLYKTGQLSYEYYKTFETLDRKFAIQSKVDAWNRVFVEGKQKFDAWEQENEVGRKVLAGIRTAWLVDEQSRMRASGRSRYRLVQSAYDLWRSIRRLSKKAIASIRAFFDEGELHSFWKGLKADLQKDGSLSTRLGAIVAAIVAVNIGGSLFSLSAVFSNLLAVAIAVIWPSWATDLLSRTQEIGLEIKAKGYRDESKSGKTINPIECIQRRYEEFSSEKMRQSKRKRQNSWKQRYLSSRRIKRKAKENSKTSSAFGSRKKKGRGMSQEVGTWQYFKRTW